MVCMLRVEVELRRLFRLLPSPVIPPTGRGRPRPARQDATMLFGEASSLSPDPKRSTARGRTLWR